MARPAIPIKLSPDERAELLRMTRAGTTEHRLVVRAQMILALADGRSNIEVARQLRVGTVHVSRWRQRFAQHRIVGLPDAPRSGRRPVYDHDARLRIVNAACRPPRETSHWSVRQLAAHLAKDVGIGKSQLQTLLVGLDLQPHRFEMWLNSQDPDFEAKQADIVGLYLHPPKNALVISIDEKTGIQALVRTHPTKPMRPARVEKREFEYVRRGVVSLFAALFVHRGTIEAKAAKRHTRVEFLEFLQHVHRICPAHKQIHIIVDNLSTHKGDPVQRWLEKHKRVRLHYTPTHASWLNQIELWFSILSRRLLKRGIFTSTDDLVQQIMTFIEEYNQSATPFAWTYSGRVLTA